MGLAEQVRRLRDERGWSQAELGRRAGTGQTQIQRFENGETRNPRADALCRLADALGITIDELLGRTPPIHGTQPPGPVIAGDDLSALRKHTESGFARLSEQLERLISAVSAPPEESSGPPGSTRITSKSKSAASR